MRERVARFADRLFDRLRHRRAFELSDDDAIDGALTSLRGSRYAVLVTFRRSGEPVPSPVWIAVDDRGVAYVKTSAHAGKVTRLARDPRVLVAPSTARGRPLGPALRAVGHVLPETEWPHAEATLAAAHGRTRQVSERMVGAAVPAAYLALTRT